MLMKKIKVMELKKHPKLDIGSNSPFYFAIGVAVMMLITYLGINHKSYEKAAQDTIVMKVDIEDEEDITLVKIQQPPPPPPPPAAAPMVIEIVEDKEEIVETIIESTETDEAEAIQEVVIEVEEVQVEEIEEEVEVPFTVIEHVPIFPGCEYKKTNDERKKCLSIKVSKHVNKRFNDGLAADLGLTGRLRIFVLFKIDKKGNVIGVKARAPHPELAKEAEKVVQSLPKMKPGIQSGKKVTVSYSLPIVFQVEE